MITAVILSVVVFALYSVLSTSSGVYEEGTRRQVLQDRIRAAPSQIANEMRRSSYGTGAAFLAIDNSALGQDDSVEFHLCTGFVGGVATYDPNTVRYITITEPGEIAGDGLDNNGNGLIDERQVVRQTRNPAGTVLTQTLVTDWVANNTFRVADLTISGAGVTNPKGTIRVSMTLNRLDDRRRLITVTDSVTVQIRNQ